MKIGWLALMHADSGRWELWTEEPPSWVYEVKQIVYTEVQK